MIFNSIRWRLQAWHGLILVLVLAGFGFSAYHVARDNQLRRVDQELDQRLGALFRPPPPPEPGSPPEHHHREARFDPAEFAVRIREAIQRAVQQAGATDAGQTNACYYVLWQADGSLLANSTASSQPIPMPQHIEPAAPTESVSREQSGRPSSEPRPGPRMFQGAARTRAEQRELFRFLPHGECILVGRSLAPELAAMHRLGLWLVVAGSSVLLLGLAGGWWLASRAIRPIEDISATAMKIAAGDLSQRIDAADTDSELGRLTAVLNSTFARLEAAFAHQSRFTSDASHELRTPLSVILSETQSSLSRERSAPEYRQALEACRRAAQRMRTLAESLLELARLDAGQEPMKREPFDLARVAREAVELLRPLAAERGVELRCELSPLECLGDAERLSQVVTNLLTNAIHFNRPQGEVRMATLAESGTAVLTVTDTGEGISAEDLPHIFERFYRADKSRSRAQGRAGLGLAISKAIVDAHGGALEVSSQPAAGSTFRLTLPLK
jgi:two-component system OmpR family sensor kinase